MMRIDSNEIAEGAAATQRKWQKGQMNSDNAPVNNSGDFPVDTKMRFDSLVLVEPAEDR